MLYKDYNYITIDPLIAEIKEELRSYFDSGAVTEAMLPTYVDQCLRKLKTIALKPDNAVMFIENYKGTLPDDFYLLDYALSYEQRLDKRANVGTLPSTTGYWSKSIECTNCTTNCDPTYEIFEKITCQTAASVSYTMTQPQWVRVYHGSRELCVNNCKNLNVQSGNIITIHEHKTVTATFLKGTIFLKYYSRPTDEQGLPMVPEVLEIEEYVKAHMKFKLFEQLWNSVVDETFKQIETKLQYYKQDSLNKLSAAIAVMRQKTRQQVNDDIVRQHRRFIKYNIR